MAYSDLRHHYEIRRAKRIEQCTVRADLVKDWYNDLLIHWPSQSSLPLWAGVPNDSCFDHFFRTCGTYVATEEYRSLLHGMVRFLKRQRDVVTQVQMTICFKQFTENCSNDYQIHIYIWYAKSNEDKVKTLVERYWQSVDQSLTRLRSLRTIQDKTPFMGIWWRKGTR